MKKNPLQIAITGGAGQIAYQLLFRIAGGELFGNNQPVSLRILELPEKLSVLEGVKMELQDCAFPLLNSIELSSDPYQGFEQIDYALLIGAKPRGPGMERKDLLLDNGKIFVEQGKALDAVAKKDAKVFVIGNPCNTNCLIAMHQAPRLKSENFYAMTRLDQNRAASFLAEKGGASVSEVNRMTIWGNHSSTQVPDFIHARIGETPVEAVINNRSWLENDFISLVQKRGAAIIQARGMSSAGSAAQAILDCVKDTLSPNQEENWFSSAILSENNPYGIDQQLVFSYPCRNKNGKITIVGGLDIPPFLEARMRASERELIEERELIRQFLK